MNPLWFTFIFFFRQSVLGTKDFSTSSTVNSQKHWLDRSFAGKSQWKGSIQSTKRHEKLIPQSPRVYSCARSSALLWHPRLSFLLFPRSLENCPLTDMSLGAFTDKLEWRGRLRINERLLIFSFFLDFYFYFYFLRLTWFENF